MAGRHILRTRKILPHEFANEREVSENDAPLLPSETGREEALAPDQPESDFQAEVREHAPGGQPMSELTGGPQGGTPEENIDGLNPLEEELQRQAERWPGKREKL